VSGAPGPAFRVHRIPFSTNVERVALACGLKGVTVQWVDHDPGDRTAIRALSGQDLFPVMETPEGAVVTDSPVILRELDARFPDPPLLPADAARREEILVFCDWFNRVWKVAPNVLADAPEAPRALRDELAGSAMRFEALLARRSHLLGEDLTLADVTVFPFLRIAAEGRPPGDDDPFHAVLAGGLALGPRTLGWAARMAAHPQA
jgi:glutathione S-transferase